MQGFSPVSSIEQSIPKIEFTGNDPFTQVNYGPTATYGMGVQDQRSRTWSVSDSITHVRGNHTLKAGIEYRNLFLPMLLYNAAPGLARFTSTSGASSGFTFADFLLGLPAASEQVAPMPMLLMKAQEFSSYAQDDWRASRRLTLSFGLRYELYGNMYEENNRFSLFDPANGAIVVASNNGVLPTSEYTPEVVAQLSDGNGNWRFPDEFDGGVRTKFIRTIRVSLCS
jgi:outer membrane receptor protein involved in Fe transport